MSPPSSLSAITLVICIFFTLVSSQGWADAITQAGMEQSRKILGEQASMKLEELRAAQALRRESQADPRIPEDAPDTEYSSLIISQQVWDIFEESMGVESPTNSSTIGNSPVPVLMVGARTITELLSEVELIISFMKRIDASPDRKGKGVDPPFLTVVQQFYVALQPIYNFIPDVLDKNGNEVPSIVGKGLLIDPSWKRNPLFVKAQLRKLLAYDEVAPNTILVSDEVLLKAIYTIGVRTWGPLISCSRRLLNLVENVWTNDTSTKWLDFAASTPKPSLEEFKRQNSDYATWFVQRYVNNYHSLPLQPFDKDGVLVREPLKSWATATELKSSMYGAVLALLNRITTANVPMMIEALFDIVLAANIFLGRRAMFPDDEFAIPWDAVPLTRDTDAIAWLEQYPETAFPGAKRRGSLFIPSPSDFKLPQVQPDADALV
ncbi:hypothetical protein TWF730_002881 [Orbilia blumenaviensis]|uniref:Uncharacterized protein n=1 Tax=Orbilia blumenaviensis TaxID=1796055 RepID=A0AAV9U772_9PEZI